MRLLITGDRNWGDDRYPDVLEVLATIMPDLCILGDARGVDTLAKRVCEALGIAHVVCVAHWDALGRAAGPIRNKNMVEHRPDLAIYLHDDLENSKGTKNCVTLARVAGIPVDSYATICDEDR